jgi:hypothetical protein
MKIPWLILLISVALSIVTACGDGGPSLLTHDGDSLVLFKRVTLAADASYRAEIEIEVRTGSNFSNMAPDGTTVVLETTFGVFENNGPRIEAKTVGGRAVNTLILPEPSRITITARSHNVEAQLVIDVNEDGSIQLDPS